MKKDVTGKAKGKRSAKVAAKKNGKGCGPVSSAVPTHALPKPGIPAVLPPVESSMKSVTVGNVIAGAHVDVYINSEWRGSAIATEATVEVGILSGPLHEGDRVTARQMVSDIIKGPGKPVTTVSSAGFYYLTQHYDVARTGWNPYETTLTVANVGKLKAKFTQNIDGRSYTQPLYAHHINLAGRGAHNVVFVATENNSVYAFDADTKQRWLWRRQLIPVGEQVVEDTDLKGCNNLGPVIGITSTPVIDIATNTMWVVAKTKKAARAPRTKFHYRLYALDIATGVDRISPVEIAGKVLGTGEPNDGKYVVFDARMHLNRAALLLLNGVVYVSFGSCCEGHKGNYQGWVFAYNTATLTLRAFSSYPDGPSDVHASAGIWQGGMGPAADSEGSIYFTTGNGDVTAHKGGRNYGDSVIKLSPALTVIDYFTPACQPTLRDQDIDLGSGGVLILPDPPARKKPAKLVAAGKDGNILLINRNNMGKYTPGGPDKLVQFPPLKMKPGAATIDQSGVWGGPAYYRSPQQKQFVYYCGSGGHLKAYLLSGNSLALAKIGHKPNQSPQVFYYDEEINPIGEGGVTPNVSSNQQVPGTGVVWTITRTSPLRLQAFDATDLTRNLLFGYVLEVDPRPPLHGHIGLVCGPWKSGGIPMIEPTTIRGKVYVASDGELNVFGL